MPADEGALVDRIVRLERRLRYWQAALLVLTCGAACVVIAGAAAPPVDQLNVRELRIVDKAGRPRMLLMTSHLGHAKVMIIDPDGFPRMQLNTDSLSFEERGRTKAVVSRRYGVDLYDDDGKRKKQ